MYLYYTIHSTIAAGFRLRLNQNLELMIVINEY